MAQSHSVGSDLPLWRSLLPAPLAASNLNETELRFLYAERDQTGHRGCGHIRGHGMPCALSDSIIADAAAQGWRPGRTAMPRDGETRMKSPGDYRLGDLFQWPSHFGPRGVPLYRWQPSIGFDYHAGARRDSDWPLMHSLIEAHPPCAPVPERACAVHLRPNCRVYCKSNYTMRGSGSRECS